MSALIGLLCLGLASLFLAGCTGGNDDLEGPLALRESPQVLPRQLLADREGFLLIFGSGFEDGMSVSLGGRLLGDVTVVNDQLVTAVVPPGIALGAQPVTVGRLGQASVTSTEQVTVVRGQPEPPTPTPTAVPTPRPTEPPRTATPAPPTPTPPPPTPAPTPTVPPTAVPTRTPSPSPTPPVPTPSASATPRPPTATPTR